MRQNSWTLACIQMSMNQFGLKLVWCYWTLYFDSSLSDFDHDSSSQKCKKAETSAPVIPQSFQLIWVEFGILLRLVSMLDLILNSSIQYLGREPHLCDFIF